MAKKIKVGFNPSMGCIPSKQPILNQIYESWDIHGETRREYEDRCTREPTCNKKERQDGREGASTDSEDVQR